LLSVFNRTILELKHENVFLFNRTIWIFNGWQQWQPFFFHVAKVSTPLPN